MNDLKSSSNHHLLYAKDCPYTSEKVRESLPFENKPKEYHGLVSGEDRRTVYQHDRDAILYTRSFRRLMHKTQVTYPGADKDEHTRTRLTHTLEVAQIARGLAYNLGLNEDLAEAIAYGHDLGHTPFGHEGEEFLDLVCNGKENLINNTPTIKEKFNLPEFTFDFKHNYQSVRVLLNWEGRYYDTEKRELSQGLNISKQTLEGILKHSSIRRKHGDKKGELYRYEEVCDTYAYFFQLDKDFAVWSVEGQIVALADEIAQVCHDLEDAIYAEYRVKHYLYQELKVFMNDSKNSDIFDALKEQNFISLKKVGLENDSSDDTSKPEIEIKKDCFHLFISWIIGYLILHTTNEISKRMDAYVSTKPENKLFPLTENLVPDEILKENKLYSFLKEIEDKYIINNIRINRENGKADFILKSLIEAYLNKPKQLPDSILERYSIDEYICPDIRKRIYKDYNPKVGRPNIRYVFEKKNDDKTLDLLKKLRSDPVFLRYLWDYLAAMTDQYALNQYKMLYLGESAYNPSM